MQSPIQSLRCQHQTGVMERLRLKLALKNRWQGIKSVWIQWREKQWPVFTAT